MGQWGKIRSLCIWTGGIVKFIPYVETVCFEEISGNSKILDVVLFDDAHNPGIADILLTTLKNIYVGKPYSEWLNDLNERDLMKQKLIYKLVFDSKVVVFEEKVNASLSEGWDLYKDTFVADVRGEINGQSTVIFQAMTKVVTGKTNDAQAKKED